MNLLLDTHSFIWYVEGSSELSRIAQESIENPQNQCYISLVSLWEMSIKLNLGKLSTQGPFETCVEDDIFENGFQILPISFPQILLNSTLPFHHRDPFDRLLIAQALQESMSIVSCDLVFDGYLASQRLVRRIW
jgi:PIN domain nuclease of toxin-antitoxin system